MFKKFKNINKKIKHFKTTKIVDPQRSKKDPSLRSTLPWVTPFKTPLKIKIRNKKLFKTVFLVKILIETCLSTNKSSNLNKKIGIQLSHQKWSNQTEFLLEPVKRKIDKRRGVFGSGLDWCPLDNNKYSLLRDTHWNSGSCD